MRLNITNRYIYNESPGRELNFTSWGRGTRGFWLNNVHNLNLILFQRVFRTVNILNKIIVHTICHVVRLRYGALIPNCHNLYSLCI